MHVSRESGRESAHLALVGELDAIGQEVEEDLPEPVWIANHILQERQIYQVASEEGWTRHQGSNSPSPPRRAVSCYGTF